MAENPQRRKEAAHRTLYSQLKAATYERDHRRETVETPSGLELGWVVYERRVMHTAVNEIRASYGLPPVDLAAIERIDNSAAGHIDWLDKFALRCAALAVGEERRG